MTAFDMRDEVRRTPFALDVAAALDSGSRQAAVAEWTGRMVDAHVSSRLFAGLLPQMMRAGVEAGFQAATAEAVVDSLRHARLCAAVVEALGMEVVDPLPEPCDVPRHDDAAPLEGLLRNVVSIICLDTTVTVAQLENRHRFARESTMRRVIAEILDDGIKHSRLGWRMLQLLAPRADAGTRERLGAYLVTAFSRLFDKHLPPYGASARAFDSKAIFVEAVNEVIVPRLEACDFPARAAVDAALAAPADDVVVWAATD